MKIFSKILPIISNKYFIATAVFLIYTLIFDTNNISSQIKSARQLKKMKLEKAYYLNEIESDSNALNELFSNKKKLEKFAREEYFMKKDNEDIFLLIGDGFTQIKKNN